LLINTRHQLLPNLSAADSLFEYMTTDSDRDCSNESATRCVFECCDANIVRDDETRRCTTKVFVNVGFELLT